MGAAISLLARCYGRDAELIQSSEIVEPPSKSKSPKVSVIDRSVAGPVVEKTRVASPQRARSIAERTYTTRRSVPSSEKSEIIERQNSNCIYCARRFDSVVWDIDGKAVTLLPRFDHFEPYALRQNENPENFVPACCVCNTLKSDRVFDTLKAARLWLAREWERKGLQDSFPGMKRFEIDVSLIDKGGWTGSGSHLQPVSFAQKPMFEATIGGAGV
jgi:5-methylcytosine-specific restriction endonuclease McrA